MDLLIERHPQLLLALSGLPRPAILSYSPVQFWGYTTTMRRLSDFIASLRDALIVSFEEWFNRLSDRSESAATDGLAYGIPNKLSRWAFIMGCLNYEALLIEKGLLDLTTGDIQGTIVYETWLKSVHRDLFIKGLVLSRLQRVMAYLPTVYIRSKTTVIGCHAFNRGAKDYQTWCQWVLPRLEGEEQAEVIPHLPALFEFVRTKAGVRPEVPGANATADLETVPGSPSRSEGFNAMTRRSVFSADACLRRIRQAYERSGVISETLVEMECHL